MFSLGDETFENFRLLGFLLKKMTCLLPTVKKIRMFTQLMSKIDPCSARADRQMMSLRGVALHKLVEGWKEEEVMYATQLVHHTLQNEEVGSLCPPSWPWTICKDFYLTWKSMSATIC